MRPDPSRIKYTISNDPDFDVARLRGIHGSPLIKVYDTVTREVRQPQGAGIPEAVLGD